MLNKRVLEKLRNFYGSTSEDIAEEARRGSSGIMSGDSSKITRDVEDAMQSTAQQAMDSVGSLMNKTMSLREEAEKQAEKQRETAEEETATMDYLFEAEETTALESLDAAEEMTDLEAKRMIDSAEATFAYPTDAKEAPLFKYITGGEAESYDTVSLLSKVEPPKPITEMTVAEVVEFQDRMKASGSKSTALGQFQIISPTMKQLIKEGAISKDDMFDVETQDKAFEHLLNKRGYVTFKEGLASATTQEEKRKAAETFQLNLAKEFASIPIPYDLPKRGLKKGDSYYKGKTGAPNEAKHGAESFLQMLMRQKV